jgi:hypothetical protein
MTKYDPEATLLVDRGVSVWLRYVDSVVDKTRRISVDEEEFLFKCKQQMSIVYDDDFLKVYWFKFKEVVK